MSAKTSEYTDICIAADVRADMLPAAPPPPSGRTGPAIAQGLHWPSGRAIAPASWSSARFECLYTIGTILIPLQAAWHVRLREMCSSAARRVPKNVLEMRDWPISWQWQQTKLVNDTGSDMPVNFWDSVQLETGYWHWQSKRMAVAKRASWIH